MVAGPTDPPFASRRSQTDNAGTRETSSAALQATASVSFGKRNFAARDWRALPDSSPAQTRENSSSDCPQPQQAAEIARIFSKKETTAVWRDWMVDCTWIKSRTTPGCAVECWCFDMRLWETEFCAQRLSGEFDGRASNYPRIRVRDRLRADNALKLRRYYVRVKFRLFHIITWLMRGHSNRDALEMRSRTSDVSSANLSDGALEKLRERRLEWLLCSITEGLISDSTLCRHPL
jgi:hypothetical protein